MNIEQRQSVRPNVVGIVCSLVILAVGALSSGGIHAAMAGDAKGPKVDDSKLGRVVVFPSIGEPVRVTPLMWATNRTGGQMEYSVPPDNVERMVEARERNAKWLVCERREDFKSVTYTFKYTSKNGKAYVYPTKGKYDRGVFFRLPSEFMLYYGDLSAYDYVDEPDYFKIVFTPAAENSGGLPDFSSWAIPGPKPFTWMDSRERDATTGHGTSTRSDFAFELWFAKGDMRLVKEIIRSKLAETGPEWSTFGNGDDEYATTEVTYMYDGAEYPRRVFVEQKDGFYISLHFGMNSGLWMFERGTYMGTFNGRLADSWYETYDVSVER